MSDTIPFPVLLANLSAELRAMTRRCHALEEATLAALGGQPGVPPDGILMRFQDLDHLTQALADLVRLVEAGTDGALAEVSIDRARVRGSLTMTSLADRLLGEGTAAPDETGDFLL